MAELDTTKSQTLSPRSRWKGLARMVRPTLIVAVGGTGSAAAKAARARITELLETEGPRHHYIAFRAFDTAYQDNREPRFVNNAEYIYLGGFNAQAVIADIVAGDAYRHWAQWLPPRLNFQQVAFGAGGIRPIGRLCYFYRRDQVEAAMQEALTTITDADLAMRFHQQTGVKVNLEAGIDIHVICSVCGGTGSGMFLDLAFDLRRWAEEHTDREVAVTGHLVLPEAFRRKPVVLTALEANAYIALQELDRFMNATSADPWIVEHVQGRPEGTWRAPFDHCYLLSGLQQGGTSDVDTLTSVIGEAVALLTLSQVGQKVSEGVINMAGQRKSTRDERGRLCCYSSYGVLGLEIPWGLLGESLGPELATRVRERLAGQDRHQAEAIEADIESFKQAMRLQPAQLEPLPVPDWERIVVATMIDDYGEKSALPRTQLQDQLRRARDKVRQEVRLAEGEEVWRSRDLQTYLSSRVEGSLLDGQGGGLSRTLHLLQGCAAALRSFAAALRASAADAKSEAERLANAGDALEQGDLTDKAWKLIWQEVEAWEKRLRQDAKSRVFATQASQLDELAWQVEEKVILPWREIQVRFSSLRLPEPRDEESYYRGRRAFASICPLSFFRHILDPHQEALARQVLSRLVSDSQEWATLRPQELADRFHLLCGEAIRGHFFGEAGIEWDRLLADSHFWPSQEYENEVGVFLQRARANWELDESYSLRTNRLEISAIGAEADSRIYQILSRTNSHISSVDEQRRDQVSILRTEHGISLIGIKRLDAYRNSLIDSIVHEQRFDLHFFLDRRWITRTEFADEEPARRQLLKLFSTAVMARLIERRDGAGYVLAQDPETVLGGYRHAAFERLGENKELQSDLQKKIIQLEQETDWGKRLREHIEELKKRVETAVQPARGENGALHPRYLSLDVFQIHAEIRALLAELQTEELGI